MAELVPSIVAHLEVNQYTWLESNFTLQMDEIQTKFIQKGIK